MVPHYPKSISLEIVSVITMVFASVAFAGNDECELAESVELNLQMHALPPVDTPRIRRQASLRQLVSSWNHMVQKVQETQKLLTKDENAALDAILIQIQTGLIVTGLARSGGVPTNYDGHAAQQLMPNTSALTSFFRRKSLENPRVKEFRQLSSDARAVADETERLAPIVPVRSLPIPASGR